MLHIATHHVPAGLCSRRHGHGKLHLVLVTQGGFEQQTPNRIRELGRGSVRLSRPHARHALAFGSDGADCLMLEADGAFWSRVFARALKGRDNAFAAAADQVGALSQIKSADRLAFSRESLVAFGRMLATVEGRASRREPAWLQDAVEALESGADRPIAAIANTLRRDRVHFARSFAAHLGFTPSEYRTLRRVGAAVAALRGGGDSLSEIALANGFSHQSHMNNDFRALLGHTPLNFRAPAA